jgi:PAS domain S-box-containing protein
MRQDQALYHFLVESLTEYAVFAVSPTGIVISWNAGAQKTFGYTESEILGKSFEVIFTAQDRATGAPALELSTALSGERTQHDRWHVRKDGTRFWGTNTVQPLYDAGGVLLGFTKLVRDSTDSHNALEELSDSEQQLRLLVESVNDYAIFSIAPEGRIRTWNAGAQKLFGYRADEIVGQNFSRLFIPEDITAGAPAKELRDAASHSIVQIERWMARKDGSRFLSRGKLNELKHDITGGVRGFVKIAHDVTDHEAAYQHERTWSTTFQQAVLPSGLPDVLGLLFDALYEPGALDAQVGGDWYDAVRLLDGRVLITVGDVTGRGLQAAVVVGVVRQIMRGIAQLHADPALVLDAADRALTLEYPEVYVTAWVGIVDLAKRTLIYSSAGHPPAFLSNARGMVRELGNPALPIGLREGVRGEISSIELTDGDTLVLYTDGLTEATRDVILGHERVRQAVAKLGGLPWTQPARFIREAVVPDGSVDDIAILTMRANFAAFESNVDRWRCDTGDADAAIALRHRFYDSLPIKDFSRSDRGAAELVFGELVGNVVRHIRGDPTVDVIIDHSGPRTVLHVLDHGVGFHYAARLMPDVFAENGRGLSLIAALTADFQVTALPSGGSHARAVLRGRLPVRFG